MDGRGVFKWPCNKKYEGSYRLNKREGFGVFSWPDGRKFKGEWKKGKQQGKGEFYTPNSKQWNKGFWEYGKLITYENPSDHTIIDNRFNVENENINSMGERSSQADFMEGSMRRAFSPLQSDYTYTPNYHAESNMRALSHNESTEFIRQITKEKKDNTSNIEKNANDQQAKIETIQETNDENFRESMVVTTRHEESAIDEKNEDVEDSKVSKKKKKKIKTEKKEEKENDKVDNPDNNLKNAIKDTEITVNESVNESKTTTKKKKKVKKEEVKAETEIKAVEKDEKKEDNGNINPTADESVTTTKKKKKKKEKA